MNTIRTILVAAAVVLATSAHAQVCSGGPEGGMDASGNQCSHSNPVAANTAPANLSSPARNTASGRSAAAASQVARPEGTVGRERRLVVATQPAATPAKGPESASVAPRAVKVSSTTGAN